MSKRILIVNKFLYPRGGDCIVALSEAELLRSAGYEVALWGMDYPDNIPTDTSRLYASQVSFSGGSLRDKLNAAGRLMGLGDVRTSFARMLREFRPHTVHFHNIHSYLSPVIVEMAHRAGIRTLWTMHDYKLTCPSYSCLSPDGHLCNECVDKPWTVVSRRCMKGSLAASIMARAEAWRWNVGRLSASTDAFICPSEFMAEKIMAGGVPRGKIHVIGNFLDPAKAEILSSIPADSHRTPGMMLYVGRLSAEKGIATLLATFASMNEPALKLRVFGNGPLESELRNNYGSFPGIEFMGHADARTIATEMSAAQMLIAPSECYENNPLSVIEALSAGTPVLGADIGGIPELISPSTGMLFESGDSYALEGAIRGMLVRSFNNPAIKAASLDRFSSRQHFSRIEKLL